MKIGTVLAAVHQSEVDLYHDLLQLSQRYVTEHEVHHVAKDVAHGPENICQDCCLAADYGKTLESNVSDVRASKQAEQSGQDASLGLNNPAGLALLWDLRSIHMAASGIAVQWTMSLKVPRR